MKDYEPTPDFVSRVMADVRATVSSQGKGAERLLSWRPARYALSAGGIILALMNVVRIVFTYLSPALCR